MDLNQLWFLLLGALLAGYAVLDGFDFGVGILHPLARGDGERRILRHAIGPIWDGNEVWLVTFGGALFAAFPEAYATVFSGFYLPFMAVLFALILRAVSLELRDKLPSPAWRGAWDAAFFAGSLAAPLLFGAAVGALLVGVPLDHRGVFAGGLRDLLAPRAHPLHPALVGAMTAALFALHGALYLQLKTEGELLRRAVRWSWHAFGVFLALYLATTIATLATVPRALASFERFPWAWGIVAVSVLAVAEVPRALYLGRPRAAFAASSVLIGSLVALLGLALHPYLVPGAGDGPGLTIYDAASSQKTLGIMAVVAAIGMPFVLGYTAVIYWTFRGKVRVDGHY